MRFMMLCIFCLWLVGCTTTGGKDFNENNAANIREGQTTKEDVIRFLGNPYQRYTQANGSEYWVYTYSEIESLPGMYAMLGNTTAKSESLSITFNRGVVTECTLTKARKEGRGLSPAYGGGTGYEEKTRCSDLLRAQSQQPATRDLKEVSRNDIREIQRILTNLGYNPGPIDGAFGKKTSSAISTYQYNSGIAVDGRATRQLLDSLRQK